MTSRRQFLKDNRKEIDVLIHSVCPGYKLNDEERWMWIENDEGLYNWARKEGVKI